MIESEFDNSSHKFLKKVTLSLPHSKEEMPNASFDLSLPIVGDFLLGDRRIHKILDLLGPKLRREPYGTPDFELASPIGESERSQLVSYMLALPGEEGHRLFRTSANLDQISNDAASHKALETMYVGPSRSGIVETGDNLSWARLFIENIHNSMAVRNRLRIVESEFGRFMGGRLTEGFQETKVLSIAAGSSRGIMEELAELNGRGHDKIKLRMVDINREALKDGRKLVAELGIGEAVEFIRAHVFSFKRYLENGYQPDFVEIVGLLDYLDDDQVIKLLAQVRNHLSEGGEVLYSNIAPNDEEEFTHRIVGWPRMQYRGSQDVLRVATVAGFTADKLRLISEPLGIYNVVSAKK